MLDYVGSLPLDGSDAQLLAVVVAVRAARRGAANLTGVDLRSLRLADAEGAVAAVTALGWQPDGDLLTGDPDTPVSVTVPELADGAGCRLPFGKPARSRVSGWSTRTLAAKPVKKASSPARLAALLMAAHSSSDGRGSLPDGLPAQCRAALPELLAKGFLSEIEGDQYRLSEAVGHLSGRYLHPHEQPLPGRPAGEAAEPPSWDGWKAQASAALLRHVENVERCPLCGFSAARVAEAFMKTTVRKPCPEQVRTAYTQWQHTQPDRGPRAAEFAAAFRTDHRHGPSIKQLCKGLGWGKQPRPLRAFIVGQLIADGWLTNTGPVPWTLRPGKAYGGGASATPQPWPPRDSSAGPMRSVGPAKARKVERVPRSH
ncbi:hypothetical protein [Streptomyces sp. NBC_00859]|uniref:hypothetical protein n=1 Tax=Streptomyces sp. NBC_00859 TaxID=2903682 RepID=UPI003869D031|nr:hypothetical protein OG584_02295 [Streptomyces sp. NBC_00859]